jgi:hypothetical protein
MNSNISRAFFGEHLSKSSTNTMILKAGLSRRKFFISFLISSKPIK